MVDGSWTLVHRELEVWNPQDSGRAPACARDRAQLVLPAARRASQKKQREPSSPLGGGTGFEVTGLGEKGGMPAFLPLPRAPRSPVLGYLPGQGAGGPPDVPVFQKKLSR